MGGRSFGDLLRDDCLQETLSTFTRCMRGSTDGFAIFVATPVRSVPNSFYAANWRRADRTRSVDGRIK